ncbi:hypothetical protein AVEN_227567-1 [Araneus ventricosus]|uniref:Partner and localiser of BRCA2 WD40 domain-containing protein n=1 Tax=Araneus ventricosus TaxID=182803 RepID=A0A4Y2C3M2_ARAVE|nr:hypothetical protein AVEN_227567-1 [Araneus ventricosus]
MASNDSDVYVAKLLEQLEELNKKKARRLKKLKKLTKVHGKDAASTSTENVSALVSPLQNIQNNSVSTCLEEKENITDLNYSNCSFLNNTAHNCIQSTAKESNENYTRTNNSSSSLNFESNSNNACLDKSLTNSTVNNVPELSIKKTQNNHSENGSDLFSENSNSDERLNQNIKDLSSSFCLNNPLNGLEENQRKMRKRSTSEISENAENSSFENKKKFKLSEDVPGNADISTKYVSENNDLSDQNDCVFSDKTEQPLSNINRNCVISSKTSDDCNEDSLSHNMTCFMSYSLFIGEEDNDNIQSNIEKSVKCVDLAELLPNPEENMQNLVSVTTCINSIISSPLISGQNDLKVSDSLENSDVQIVSSKHPSEIMQETKCNDGSSHVSDIALHSFKELETTETSDFLVNIVKTPDTQILDNLCEAHILPESTKIESAATAIKFDENLLVEEVVLPPQNPVHRNSFKSDSHSSVDSQKPFNTWSENEIQWEFAKDGNEVNENLTPSLLDSAVTHSHQTELKYKCVEENKIMNGDSVGNPVTVVQTIDISDDGLVDDALTADIDFNSSMSLEVSDTADSLLNESSKEQIAASLSSYNGHLMQEQNMQCDTNAEGNTEVCVLDTEIFTIPETEFFESSHSNEVDTVIENKACIEQEHGPTSNHSISINPKDDILAGAITDSLQTFGQFTSNNAEKYNDSNFPNEQFSETLCGTLDLLHTVQETLLLEAEDTQHVRNQNIPVTERFSIERYSSSGKEIAGESNANVTLTHSFHSDIGEAVQNIKFIDFSHSSYVFIQHITWIQIWHQEVNKDWIKVFSHEVGDKLQLKDICCSTDTDYLILIMLLKSEEMYCLQFLLFEKERKVIKLMEHTHWLKNKCSDNPVLLCGLEGLKFAVAQGNEDRFEVFVHVFNCLEENPRLLTAVLGSTVGSLKSLCSIEKLPNALMGTSESTLYVWHVLEARLVTSVNLQSSDPLLIENCIWATIENGLVFFIAVCKTNSSQGCELLAANLATGFCQRVMLYSIRPARGSETFSDKNIKAIYKEPFLAVTCAEGTFLWCVTNEYCCAALDKDADVSALAIHRDDDTVSVVVGNRTGCVNSYNINCA